MCGVTSNPQRKKLPYWIHGRTVNRGTHTRALAPGEVAMNRIEDFQRRTSLDFDLHYGEGVKIVEKKYREKGVPALRAMVDSLATLDVIEREFGPFMLGGECWTLAEKKSREDAKLGLVALMVRVRLVLDQLPEAPPPKLPEQFLSNLVQILFWIHAVRKWKFRMLTAPSESEALAA